MNLITALSKKGHPLDIPVHKQRKDTQVHATPSFDFLSSTHQHHHAQEQLITHQKKWQTWTICTWAHIRMVAEPDIPWHSPVEVAHLIMDYFDFRDLCQFSCVSILSFQRVLEYLYHNFSVHHILSPFFPNEEDLILFCKVQWVHSVLISGSQALSIFTQTMYPNSDLNLYVTQWQCL